MPAGQWAEPLQVRNRERPAAVEPQTPAYGARSERARWAERGWMGEELLRQLSEGRGCRLQPECFLLLRAQLRLRSAARAVTQTGTRQLCYELEVI